MLPWYLREDKYQFARAVRKHNPLERMVMAVLDTEALKRGAGETAGFYYLGHGPDGRLHLCASPDYQTCVHQMRCTECEMHVDAEEEGLPLMTLAQICEKQERYAEAEQYYLRLLQAQERKWGREHVALAGACMA